MAIQVGELGIGEKFWSDGYNGTVVAKGGRTVSVLLEGPGVRQIDRIDRNEVVYVS